MTIDNPLGDLVVDSHVEVFEDLLSKILINAWEAYDQAPESQRPILIRTGLVDRGNEGPVIRITVEDQGKGIAPEIRDHMFEPFISNKHTVGVGMGLTVARHALRNMGGDLTVEDRPGGGMVAVLLHPVEKRRRQNTDV
jgi:C4-dicarboxylate-specific signal transduction histidine kinase